MRVQWVHAAMVDYHAPKAAGTKQTINTSPIFHYRIKDVQAPMGVWFPLSGINNQKLQELFHDKQQAIGKNWGKKETIVYENITIIFKEPGTEHWVPYLFRELLCTADRGAACWPKKQKKPVKSS